MIPHNRKEVLNLHAGCVPDEKMFLACLLLLNWTQSSTKEIKKLTHNYFNSGLSHCKCLLPNQYPAFVYASGTKVTNNFKSEVRFQT